MSAHRMPFALWAMFSAFAIAFLALYCSGCAIYGLSEDGGSLTGPKDLPTYPIEETTNAP